MAAAGTLVKQRFRGLAQSRLFTIFRIKELRQKIFITLLFLTIYRIGFHIPLPMIDQLKLARNLAGSDDGLLGLISMFSGGNLGMATIFGLGIMPYISASIILELFATVYPPLEKLKKEGESGRKKINEYTRYLTVLICFVQAIIYIQAVLGGQAGGQGMLIERYGTWPYMFVAVLTMTAGSVFLMWIGEQIDEYGIGNGISLIIMAGIVARIPEATSSLLWEGGRLKSSIFTLGGSGVGGDVSLEKLIVLMCLFIAVVVAVVAITKGQRRIPTQSAKHVKGRRMYGGGSRQYLPLKVNQAGVMPVIFASSLLLLPTFGFQMLSRMPWGSWAAGLESSMARDGFVYNISYVMLIYFFCYFWTSIIFNPKEMANNLKDYGNFIPGYRPGKRTAEYLEKVMMRITYVGAAFLAIVAIIPTLVSTRMEVSYAVASFYGGTGLLIVVSVALDLVQKINSHLVMRNYPALTED
ncbi:MAG: preprotein translocase subunit SecY [Gemmataceae bacterium]